MKTNNKISQQTYPDHDTLPPLLENLRKEKQGQQVPEGYFDTLSPRIVDRIGNRNRQNRLFIILTTIRKKFVWAPVMATSVIAVLLIFVIPGPKQLPVAPSDELSQILQKIYPGKVISNQQINKTLSSIDPENKSIYSKMLFDKTNTGKIVRLEAELKFALEEYARVQKLLEEKMNRPNSSRKSN